MTHFGARRSHDDADTEEIYEFLNGNIIAASAEFFNVSTLKHLVEHFMAVRPSRCRVPSQTSSDTI